MASQQSYEVLIIGGGPAGLSAAMSLGRMSRSALVVDDNRARNAPAEHMNNFVSHDGLNPEEWRKIALKDLSKYRTVEFALSTVVSLSKVDKGFVAVFKDGRELSFRKIVLAHGVEDKLNGIKGMAELWGKSIYHCPYCHGYEVRGKRLGLVVNGAVAEHITPMIFSLSTDTILFTNGVSEPSDEFLAKLKRKGVRVVNSKIQSLDYTDTQLKAVVLEDGEKIARDGLFWAPTMPYKLKSDLGTKLGCELTELGIYKVNDFGKTTVDGIFAAGDISRPMHSVLMAASAGQLAGAAAAGEILAENFAF